MILKGLTRSFRGPGHHNTHGIGSFNQTLGDQFFEDDLPQTVEDYARATFYDKSDDRLGRLAEINKSQMEQALRDIKGFSKTEAGFNNSRSMIKKPSDARTNEIKEVPR